MAVLKQIEYKGMNNLVWPFVTNCSKPNKFDALAKQDELVQ